MKCKEGVILKDLKLEMRLVLKFADEIWNVHGQELWVTSTGDGVHSAGSLHPYGYAVDFRTRYFRDVPEIAEIRDALQMKLGPKYQVLMESRHMHCEYQAAINQG